MKKSFSFLCTLAVVILALLSLSACRSNFSELLSKAEAQYQSGHYVDVIDTLNLALLRWRSGDGNESKGKAYLLLGESYQQMHRVESASENFRQAVQLSTNTYEAAYQLGVYSLGAKDFKLAQSYFQSALKMKRDDPLALLGYGDTLQMTGKYADAKAAYERVLAISPGVTDAMENLKLIAERQQQTGPIHMIKTPKRKVVQRSSLKKHHR